MPFVTTITLRSGDRDALDDVVGDIRDVAERKGIEMKGPHTSPPIEVSAPLYRRTTGDGEAVGTWEYTVYERTFRIVGHEEIARQIAGRGFPPAVRVEVEVERTRSIGRS